MQVSVRELERIFAKLDLQAKSSNHHITGWLVVDGRRVLPLHYSKGRKDLPGNVPERFRRSMFLEPDEFADMKRCTMTRVEYVQILRDRGVA
jgi:hypothetical protein